MTEWLLEVFVAGRPAPQGSKMARPIYRGRGTAREFTGRVAQVESSKSGVNTWRADVRAAVTELWAGRDPLDCALEVELEFVMPRPASAPKRTTPPAVRRPDVSKLARATEDALESAGLYVDDARIVREVLYKRIAEPGERSGCWVRVALWSARRSTSGASGGVNGANRPDSAPTLWPEPATASPDPAGAASVPAPEGGGPGETAGGLSEPVPGGRS